MSQKTVNISQELSALEEKKHALEKVYRIARAVEHLRYGLEAIVLLGKPTASISKQAVHVYESLNDKIKIQPTLKIQQTILRLDTIVTKNLNTVLQAASTSESAQSADEAHPSPFLQQNLDALIDAYRKNAQTAVALRVVLRERGVPTKPISWPVSGELFTQRLNYIRSKENNYRRQIDREIVKLQKDAEVIIQNDKLPQATRNAAANMHLMLNKDLKHIRAGKDIADMPYFVEVVVMQDEMGQPQTLPQPQKNSPTIATAPISARKHKSLMYKLWLWATTPLSIKWKDIEKRF